MDQPSYSFAEPRPKRRRNKWTQSVADCPFPVPVASILGLPASNSRWHYFTGRLVGCSVYVDDNANDSLLYQMVSVNSCVILMIK